MTSFSSIMFVDCNLKPTFVRYHPAIINEIIVTGTPIIIHDEKLMSISNIWSATEEQMRFVCMLEVPTKTEYIGTMKKFLKEIVPDTRAYDGCKQILCTHSIP